MPQVLKDEVRARILGAALEVFAAEGFARATMAAIASRAGIGTASIYRYYPGKDELFAAVITPELTQRFESLLERRVSALARSMADDTGDDMLRFWIENRLAVVVLLDRAAGTPHEPYAERFVDLLVEHTLAELPQTHPGLHITPSATFVLRSIFENTRRFLAAALEQLAEPEELRAAIQAFWSYQIAGLRSLGDHLAARRAR